MPPPSHQGEGGELCVEVRGERVLLQRGGLEEKSSDVVKALVRANPSYASTAISSLLGSSKDDSCEWLSRWLGRPCRV